ncbi:MAG: FAD-dependent oxidoreductase, partial [Leifsonia sp.]
ETIVVESGEGVWLVGFWIFVIGTGSAPCRLPIPGAEKAVTSHDFFRLGADLPFPARPVIIGGGYIGVELASMLEHLGAKPVVLELTDQLLPGFDADLATFLGRSLGGRVDVRLGAEVTAIEESGGSLLVRYRTRGAQGAEEFSVSGDQVVMATGRVSVLPDGVEALELDRDASGAPVVDSRLATSRPSVWAPGDVNRRSMLFHSAVRQSAVVAHNILAGGPADRMNFSGVPFTVFTDPEIASVGLTESEASRKVDEVAIGTYDCATDSRAQIFGETDGFLKLVFDGHTGRLLGAQLAGLDAAQLAAPLALAVHAGLGATQLAESAFPHPMVSEGINKAARSVLS